MSAAVTPGVAWAYCFELITAVIQQLFKDGLSVDLFRWMLCLIESSQLLAVQQQARWSKTKCTMPILRVENWPVNIHCSSSGNLLFLSVLGKISRCFGPKVVYYLLFTPWVIKKLSYYLLLYTVSHKNVPLYFQLLFLVDLLLLLYCWKQEWILYSYL